MPTLFFRNLTSAPISKVFLLSAIMDGSLRISVYAAPKALLYPLDKPYVAGPNSYAVIP